MRSFLTLLAAILCVAAVAQKQPKPNINKAKAAFDKGEYGEAKSLIDIAVESEKFAENAKAWYYRGMIYATLDTASQEPGAMDAAVASFQKSLELDPEQKTTSEFTGMGIANVDTRLQGYYAFYYNKAIASYQTDDFANATDNFEYAFYIMPTDTNAIINAAYAASAADDDDRAKTNYTRALDAGVKDKSIFLRLYNYAVQEEDYDAALAVIQRGRSVMPNDIDLQKYEINILITQNKVDEALAGIQEAIEKEPNNPDLHFSMGVIKEESGDEEGARASYEKALEVDESHYNSNFNLAVMEFNKANDMIKERSELSYKEKAKIAELTKTIKVRLESAMPYWEKLYSLKSTDETVLETLAYIYQNLGMNDKAEQIMDELDAIRG